jgi:hypothetical protein
MARRYLCMQACCGPKPYGRVFYFQQLGLLLKSTPIAHFTGDFENAVERVALRILAEVKRWRVRFYHSHHGFLREKTEIVGSPHPRSELVAQVLQYLLMGRGSSKIMELMGIGGDVEQCFVWL